MDEPWKILKMILPLPILYIIINTIFIIAIGSDLMWMNILAGTISSILATAAMTTIVYFKFLKHIPEETEKKINNLLNQRLNYETTNHNALISNLHQSENHLSDEHSSMGRDIIKLSSAWDTQREEKRQQYQELKKEYQRIIDSISTLKDFGEIFRQINSENNRLQKENQSLKQTIKLNNEKSNNKNRNNIIDYE